MSFTKTNVRDFRARIDKIGEEIPQAIADELNATAAAARERGIQEITKRVNLTKQYVADHLTLVKAGGSRFEATVYARARGVLLTRFPYQVLRVPNKTKKGTKPAGITGQIVPGRTYTQPKFFRLRLLGSEAPGIAVRVGKPRKAIKVLHGPSVSQVFRTTLPALSSEFATRLADRVSFAIERIYDGG